MVDDLSAEHPIVSPRLPEGDRDENNNNNEARRLKGESTISIKGSLQVERISGMNEQTLTGLEKTVVENG